ncbi:lysyl oxidase homolog 3 [Tribolium castaneum]|uniref:protein-lysine 6-oxidase n=1 Tax=Tribolium castaneum TaxID=7070 RepID=D6X0V2_TRICA|nr:PREDICTED: lysyl oxidase homolog 3 [Tribolium castaneum]EFA10680.1 Lysyl oxidase homolog 3-like Protein [Tribolium castaneum]|eukprot:XP_015839256.1 PREDICTED: lysyl oxidase homolog 3 [Tribolium castaneum]
MNVTILLMVLSSPSLLFASNFDNSKRKKAFLVKKHLKRLKKVEGGVKLIGGRDEFEGNVEILHEGQWGAICDDEWDSSEAHVVCQQLGYPKDSGKATVSSYFGPAKRKFWMDNVFCSGNESEIIDCRFDGWGNNDCTSTEAAGVICHEEKPKEETTKKVEAPLARHEIRLKGGRVKSEGRVEIKNEKGQWASICGDGWSLLEGLVVCKHLGLGYASDAPQTDFFGGNITDSSYSGVRCRGNETSFGQCVHDLTSRGKCQSRDVAAVSCVSQMSDLVIDHIDLMRTAHLEDRQLFFLQCAMEENCLASEAYKIQKEDGSWHLETRRLLRFTARIFNAGTADFRPTIPKHLWEWHMCHMHYHSMEVFATFDIYDTKGLRVAEGHKASFCLEDNQCLPGVKPRYACANYGDQGISVNCSDIYKYTVDCQWVDISELEPGIYTLKVAINPEFKVPEITFENNAAVCQFIYSETFGTVTNCTVQRP